MKFELALPNKVGERRFSDQGGECMREFGAVCGVSEDLSFACGRKQIPPQTCLPGRRTSRVKHKVC